jgi:3-deoxy-D-manno-octulosonate 8-phosphate phosphatase (KDO 8-P phosphatase)
VSANLQVASTGKVAAVEALLAERQIGWDEMIFVGDDLPDVPVLRRVGLPIAVANARPEVKAVCQYVTEASGGHGALREVVELLLRARGEWDHAAQHYLGADA